MPAPYHQLEDDREYLFERAYESESALAAHKAGDSRFHSWYELTSWRSFDLMNKYNLARATTTSIGLSVHFTVNAYGSFLPGQPGSRHWKSVELPSSSQLEAYARERMTGSPIQFSTSTRLLIHKAILGARRDANVEPDALNVRTRHFHLLAQLPPRLTPSEAIRRVKGAVTMTLKKADVYAPEAKLWASGNAPLIVGSLGYWFKVARYIIQKQGSLDYLSEEYARKAPPWKNYALCARRKRFFADLQNTEMICDAELARRFWGEDWRERFLERGIDVDAASRDGADQT